MKTLQQVKERIQALESRTRDWIDILEEVDTLKDIECLREDLDDEDFKSVSIERWQQFLVEENFNKVRIYIWALE